MKTPVDLLVLDFEIARTLGKKVFNILSKFHHERPVLLLCHPFDNPASYLEVWSGPVGFLEKPGSLRTGSYCHTSSRFGLWQYKAFRLMAPPMIRALMP